MVRLPKVCIIGAGSHGRIPVIEGLPPPRSEDQLKALGAAAASLGSVALFHAIGTTPEAPTLSDAFGAREPDEIIERGRVDLACERVGRPREQPPAELDLALECIDERKVDAQQAVVLVVDRCLDAFL